VPSPTCRILSTLNDPAGNAASQASRHIDVRSTRCGRIVPSYAIGFAVRTVSYSRNAPDRASPATARNERTLTLPAQANGLLNVNVTPNEDFSVDLSGYFVAAGTPLGPIGNSLPTSADMSTPSANPHADSIGHPVAQYMHDGAQGEIYLDASVLAGSGVLMTAPNSSSPWITAKLRSADGSSGFAVANSANNNLLTARSDGAVQLLNGAFLDGRTDYFGSAGQYYGYVPIPTNIVHDVTLVDPHDAANGATTRVVFYNAQTDDEYSSPDVTKYRAYTFGYYNTKHINFDSQINYHRDNNLLYHFRAFSPSDGAEGKDTFWVKPGTDGGVTTGTRADMYVSGNVGIGTPTPAAGVKFQVEDLNNNSDMLLSAGDYPGSPNSATFSLMRKDGNHLQLAKYGFKLDANDGNKFKLLYGGAGAFTTTPLVVDTSGNVGIGTTNPAAGTRLDVTGAGHFTGNVTVDGIIYAKYQDVAEWVPSEGDMTSGTVVVLNRMKTNAVTPSTKAYDTAVAGVVSDQPGVLLGVGGENKAKIATTGRVKVRVDARTHAVHIGDLLVTSDTPGTAMLSEPLDLAGVKLHRPGTLIGKALEPLAAGEGEILVLLSLQ